MKRRRFFLVKRAWCPHIAFALIGLARIPHHFTTYNLRKAEARAQFIKESGGQAHARSICRSAGRVQLAIKTFALLRKRRFDIALQVFLVKTIHKAA